MKRIYAFLGTLITVCKLQADPSIDWISDSYSAFDVILGGSGPGWTGTITSPSGLWQLSSENVIEYPYALFPGGPVWVHIQNFGLATFLGQLPPQLPPPGSETSSISRLLNNGCFFT